MKLFWTFDNEVVKQCQFYTGFTTVEYLAKERKDKFMNFLPFSPCILVKTLSEILNTHKTVNWSVV